MNQLRNSPTRFSIPRLTYRVWSVWQRNLDVFMKTIRVNFLPSLLEPILYLVALGLGLGGFVQPIEGVPYINFIAPALVAISIMYGSFFECTYASFVRMYFQKTFDAIVATPVSVEEVVAGELLWGATRSAANSTIVLLVVAAFGLVTSPSFILVPSLSFTGGLLFASLAMCFTALAPNIDFFNYPTFLLITPMFLLSGTFFPISSLPSPASIAAQTLPLTHIVGISRGLISGALQPSHLVSALYIGVATIILFILSINLMKKRLVK